MATLQIPIPSIKLLGHFDGLGANKEAGGPNSVATNGNFSTGGFLNELLGWLVRSLVPLQPVQVSTKSFASLLFDKNFYQQVFLSMDLIDVIRKYGWM